MLDATIGTLVTYNPKSVGPKTALAQLQETMEQLQVRHMPVIDDEHCVIGMVSERDVARMLYQAATKSAELQGAAAESIRVEKMMVRHVTTIEHFQSPEIALRAMVEHGFHSVPVTESDRLVGMITSTDFLRELSFGEWVGHDEPVRRWMNSPGRTVESETSLGQVAEIAEQYNQEFAVVVRRYRPIGILSRTALRHCLYGGGNPQEISEMRATPVRLLVSSLPELTAEMALSQAATLMLEHRAQALAVVERTRVLLGLLTEDDILRAMLQRLAG